MKVSLTIEYSAEADREGESAEDEVRALEAIGEAAEEFVGVIRRKCEAAGLTVTVER